MLEVRRSDKKKKRSRSRSRGGKKKDTVDQAAYEDTLFDILGADAEEFRAYLREKRRRAGDEDALAKEMERLKRENEKFKQQRDQYKEQLDEALEKIAQYEAARGKRDGGSEKLEKRIEELEA